MLQHAATHTYTDTHTHFFVEAPHLRKAVGVQPFTHSPIRPFSHQPTPPHPHTHPPERPTRLSTHPLGSQFGSRMHWPTSDTAAAMSDIVRTGTFCIRKPGTTPGVEMMGVMSFYTARRHNFSMGRTTVADWDVHEVQSNEWRKPIALRARSAPPITKFLRYGNLFTYKVTIASQAGGL
jgi:hypothetical protein